MIMYIVLMQKIESRLCGLLGHQSNYIINTHHQQDQCHHSYLPIVQTLSFPTQYKFIHTNYGINDNGLLMFTPHQTICENLQISAAVTCYSYAFYQSVTCPSSLYFSLHYSHCYLIIYSLCLTIFYLWRVF